MWCQAPVDSRAPDEITCSAAYPVVLELLKSNTRAHARSVVMLTQQAMVIAVVAPIAFRLAGMLTYAPFVLLVPARLTAPVPTMCVAEKVAVPVPTFVSVPLRPLPEESAAVVPLVSSNLYCRTIPVAHEVPMQTFGDTQSALLAQVVLQVPPVPQV